MGTPVVWHLSFRPILYTTFKTDVTKVGLVFWIFNFFIIKILQGRNRFVEKIPYRRYLPLSKKNIELLTFQSLLIQSGIETETFIKLQEF